MNLKNRLKHLEETARAKYLPLLVIFYRSSVGLSDEQQAQIDKAETEGRPVKIIRITRAEDGFIQDSTALSWTKQD